MEDTHGFKTRALKNGTVVLDGDQKATAYLDYGYCGIEPMKEVYEFKDGELVGDVTRAMERNAQDLLANSNVYYGWYPGDPVDE